jgi:hypothetical protein
MTPTNLLFLGLTIAVLAVQTGVAGAVTRLLPLQVLTPVLACSAWLVIAPSLVEGAVWWTMPVGLALIAVAVLLRRHRRSKGGSTGPEAATELLGIVFLVSAFVVRAVTDSVAWAVLVVAIGLLVTGWGVATRMRRRVVAGAAVVIGATVLLIVVPLAALLPTWGGAGVWIIVAGLGILAVGAATLLERGRTAVTGLWHRLGDPGSGWE